MSTRESVYISPEWREKLLAAGFPPEELTIGVAEDILRMLPKNLGEHQPLHIFRMLGGGWRVMYVGTDYHGTNDTLVHAASAMYCFLSAQGLLPKL